MEYRGTVELSATPDQIWAAMIDPAVLVDIIPYASKVEKLSDSDYQIHVGHKVGGFNLKLKVALRIEDPQPPTSWRLKGKANALLIGGVTAWADVSQVAIPSGSALSYIAAGTVPDRLLTMMGDKFHDKVRDAIEAFFRRLEARLA